MAYGLRTPTTALNYKEFLVPFSQISSCYTCLFSSSFSSFSIMQHMDLCAYLISSAAFPFFPFHPPLIQVMVSGFHSKRQNSPQEKLLFLCPGLCFELVLSSVLHSQMSIGVLLSISACGSAEREGEAQRAKFIRRVFFQVGVVVFFCQYGKEPLTLKKKSHVNVEGMTVSTENFSHIK